MLSFIEYLNLNEAAREPETDAEILTIQFLEKLDAAIQAVDVTESSINTKTNSKTIYVDQYMLGHLRTSYTAKAEEIVKADPEWELAAISKPARIGKDLALKHPNIEKTVYIQNRPTAGFKSDGDPNELFSAALALLPKVPSPETPEELDAIIAELQKVVKSGKVKGATAGQIAGMTADYGNLCAAISSAATIPSKYQGADMVYLTGQAWDDDVKQFQVSKYGMKDFNSSDYIIKKGDNFLGVSLKKKGSGNQADPTLINKGFTGLAAALNELDDNPNKDQRLALEKLDDQIALFYAGMIIDNVDKFQPAVKRELESILSKGKKSAMKYLIGGGKKRPWKKLVNGLDNSVINAALKSQRSVLKTIDTLFKAQAKPFAESLIKLIFKSELKDLQKVNFDFALVTGVGRYLKMGPVIAKGEYKDVDTMTTILDELLGKGKIEMRQNPDVKQAFQPGATSATLSYILVVGGTPLLDITIRYKCDFRSSPSIMSTMRSEFKALFH